MKTAIISGARLRRNSCHAAPTVLTSEPVRAAISHATILVAMAQRTTPPVPSDHVGSLLRPAHLLQARTDHAEQRISDEELRAIEDEAIRDAVALERAPALRSATDGEFRRASWHMDYIYELGGISKVVDSTLKVQFHNEQGGNHRLPPAP